MPEKISFEELQQKIEDPDVPDAEIRSYLTGDKNSSRAFSPAVVPDPNRVIMPDGQVPGARDAATRAERGARIMQWANGIARRRRERRFDRRRENGETLPILVSEGDSWFQFPLLLDDVIDQLGNDYLIWSLDAAGDTLDNMVKKKPEFLDGLARFEGGARALLFSGAGNDIVGEDASGNPVIPQLVLPFDASRTDPSWYIGTQEFRDIVLFIEDCYRDVLEKVGNAYPGLPVILHGYDYSIPGGNAGEWRNPSYASVDQWLGKPFHTIGIVDADLQKGIVRAMIDTLNAMQISLCGGNHPGGAYAHAFHVDVRGVVDHDWNDELHPTDDGYRKVADRFRPVLMQALAGA